MKKIRVYTKDQKKLKKYETRMIDLKPIEDLIYERNDQSTVSIRVDVLFKMVEEITFLRSLTKGCCCTDGSAQDILKEPVASFSNENNPFPQFGTTTCHKCNGLNVLTALNARQKQTINKLYQELEQAREEREQVAALLVKQRLPTK